MTEGYSLALAGAPRDNLAQDRAPAAASATSAATASAATASAATASAQAKAPTPATPRTSNRAAVDLAAVAARDDEAIARFYQAHADGVFRFILRRVGGSREDAEELTQDTFLAAIKLAATFEGRSSVFVWLCGIARTQIARHYRDRTRLKQIPQDRLVYEDEETLRLFHDTALTVDFPERIAERTEAQQITRLMMTMLAEDEREALLLHYVDQMSAAEIGVVLHRTEKGVRNLMTRAKQKAVQRMEAWRRQHGDA